MDSQLFSDSLARLKEQLGVTQDAEAAEALGMSKSALSDRKRRNAFPAGKVYALATQRPELGIDAEYVVTGTSPRRKAAAMLGNFGTRLVEIRDGRSPEEFAALVGVSVRELQLVEDGTLPPTNDLVQRLLATHPHRSAIWLAGGEAPRLEVPPNDLEVNLIKNYRAAPEPGRVEIREIAAAWASGARTSAQPATPKRLRGHGVEMIVHGNIGQRLDGSVGGNNTVVMGNVGKAPKPKK